MSLRKLFFILTLIFHGCLAAQDIPAIHRTRYYYQYSDSTDLRMTERPADIEKLLLEDNLIFIDSHSLVMEMQNGYDSIANVSIRYVSGSFFAGRFEVSNAEYRKFLKAAGTAEDYPDTGIWVSDTEEPHPYRSYYFQHEAYDAYPVLGISYTQAQSFCRWKEKMLNQKLQQKNQGKYRIVISIPTEAEWQNLYYNSIEKWYDEKPEEVFPKAVTPSYLNFMNGPGGYRCNFGVLQSYRLQELKTPQRMEFAFHRGPVPVHHFPGMGEVHHLLGNAAEWTSTSAVGRLFHTKDFLLTMSGNIVPYPGRAGDSSSAAAVSQLNEWAARLMVVKGGSWSDDIFYLQPAAVRLEHTAAAKQDIGFRYIARVVLVP